MATPRKLPLHVRILQGELDERKSRNPRYSMRALARLLDIDPASLSRVLAGKQELSLEACRVILTKLALTPGRMRLFIASVAEDRRNRSLAALTRALDPRLLVQTDDSPRFENIVFPAEQKRLADRDVFALEKDFVSIMDLDGRFLHANETIAKSLDMIPDELIGERWPPTTFDVQTPALLEKQQVEVVNAKREMTFEFTVGRHENARVLRRTITPVIDGDGQMTAYISTIRDVTWDRFLQRAASQIFSSVEVPAVLANSVRASTPLFADSCVIQLSQPNDSVVAYHPMTAGDLYADFIRDSISSFTPQTDRSRLIDLTDIQSRKMTYENQVPTNAIVSSLKLDEKSSGVVIFLAQRRFSDFEIQIADDLAHTMSSALRNAQLCSKHA